MAPAMDEEEMFRYLFQQQQEKYEKLFRKYNISERVDTAEVEAFIRKGRGGVSNRL